MSNTAALRTARGAGRGGHRRGNGASLWMEYSAIASACGLLVMPVRGHHGAPDLGGVKWALRKGEDDVPAPGIVCLENTHNAAGGTVLTPAQIDDVAAAAHESRLPGAPGRRARFNAAVRSAWTCAS